MNKILSGVLGAVKTIRQGEYAWLGCSWGVAGVAICGISWVLREGSEGMAFELKPE